MKIKYWTGFSKRKNSTKQPTGGTEIDVYLKEDTSIINPTFDCASVAMNANYIYCSDFGRYYFVRDVVRAGAGRVLLQCEVDTLATYKTVIGGLSAYVEYTSSSTNTDITDPRNRPTIVTDETHDTIYDMLGMGFLNGYRYVAGVASDEGINYYLLEKSELDDLVKALFGYQSVVSALTSQFFDMKSCLVSCIAIPINKSSDLYENQAINIDGHNIKSGTTWSKIKDSKRILKHTVAATALSFPSDSLGYDYSYLDVAPYTSGNIFLPFTGIVPLDMDIFAQNKVISIEIACDICTGDIVYTFHRENGDKISSYQGNCAANVPIAGQSYNAIGVASSALGVIGGGGAAVLGVATENAAAAIGGLTTAANSALSALMSAQAHTQINGSISSMVALSLGLEIKYCIHTRRPSEIAIDTAFKAISGMPYFKGDTIGNLSGYVKCNGASISIAGTSAEKDIVDGYLNSGFYYE